MRVLILGGAGMLGHKLWQVFRERFETWVTLRADSAAYASYGFFDPKHMVPRVDVFDFDSVVRAVAVVRPQAVVNAIGIVKQLPAADDPLASLTVNSLFPHRLALLCRTVGARLVHLSTDCVFSGLKGMYTEEEAPDPPDLYGRSKLLGEVNASGCLTVRTSLIGRQLGSGHGLVEWFLGNREGSVRGYTKAIFSGLPTLVIARIFADVIEHHRDLCGLYHLSSDPISKYELLSLLREAYQMSIEIVPFPDIRVDRSLDSSRFRAATGIVPPPWSEMIRSMAADSTLYPAARHVHAA